MVSRQGGKRRSAASVALLAVALFHVAAAVPCKVTRWSDWSACSKSCGLGEKSRRRSVIAKGDEGECPALQEFTYCNENPCPIDCIVSPWSAYGACSEHCGGGTQKRRRTVTRPAEHSGKCVHLAESRACSTQTCGHYEHGVAAIPSWSRRVKCVRIDFRDTFSAVPRVFITAVQATFNETDTPSAPVSAWVESANAQGMRVCADGSSSGATANLQLQWLAADHNPALFSFLCSKQLVRSSVAVLEMPAAAATAAAAAAPACTQVKLQPPLASGVPQVTLSAFRPSSAVAAARPGFVGMQAWAEAVRLDGFRACVQPAVADGEAAQALDAPAQVSFAAYSGMGTPDPQRDAPCAASTVRSGMEPLPTWSGGVKCHLVQMDPPLAEAPKRVLVTAGRKSASDFYPTSVVTAWAETAEKDALRVCVRETDGPGARKGLYVNYAVFAN